MRSAALAAVGAMSVHAIPAWAERPLVPIAHLVEAVRACEAAVESSDTIGASLEAKGWQSTDGQAASANENERITAFSQADGNRATILVHYPNEAAPFGQVPRCTVFGHIKHEKLISDLVRRLMDSKDHLDIIDNDLWIFGGKRVFRIAQIGSTAEPAVRIVVSRGRLVDENGHEF